MNLKTLATTTMALCFVAGAAFAQATGGAAGTTDKGGSGTNIAPFASEQEKMMYDENKDMLSGFFTDDTMTTLRSDDEIGQSFAAMDPDKQKGLRAACQTAMDDKDSYNDTTASLCTNLMGR